MTTPKTNPNKRPRYFDGQFLKDVDFISEQNYHIDRQRRYARLLTVSGIAEGLEWAKPNIKPGETSVNGLTVTITAGTAIDPEGRQIVLLEDRDIPLPEGAKDDQVLYIAYSEAQSKEDGDVQESGSTRVIEIPEIKFVAISEYDSTASKIALAKLKITNEKVAGLDLSIRQYSGIYLPSSAPAKDGLSLQSGGNSNPRLAVLNGDLSVQNSLEVLQTSHLSGNVGIGINPGDKQLTVKGGASITNDLSVNTLSVNSTSILTGYVGIGISDPTVPLEIGNPTNDIPAIKVGRKANNPSIQGKGDWLILDGGKIGLNYWSTQDIILAQGGGNVGIGTASPTSPLEIGEPSTDVPTMKVARKGGNPTIKGMGDWLILDGGKVGLNYWSNSHVILAQGGGNVGIGTTEPSEGIHLKNKSLRIDSGEIKSYGTITIRPDIDNTGDKNIVLSGDVFIENNIWLKENGRWQRLQRNLSGDKRDSP